MDFSKIDELYSSWDSDINPYYLLYSLFKTPVSRTTDQREYSDNVIVFLKKNAELITIFKNIKNNNAKQNEDFDSLPRSFYQDLNNAFLFNYKNNLVEILSSTSSNTFTVNTYYPSDQKSIHEEFAEFVISTKKKSKVSVLIPQNGGLTTREIAFEPPKIYDLEMNYGKGFNKIYDLMVERLEEKRSGIFLMRSIPGTGKSNLIKYLSSIIDREFIYVPINLAENLSSPDMLSLLLSKKECVLILEDAEKAIQSREDNDHSVVSVLLNLADGILGSMLNISIIVTYNTEDKNVDAALLRPGRLLFNHMLRALNPEEAQRLSNHLGFDIQITKPMTLAEIYNQKIDNKYIKPEKKRMGFV